MINIKTNVPSVESVSFSSQQDLFDYVDSVPAGTYFIYITRQGATGIGIPGATSAAATAFFGHLMIFKRSDASIYIQHFPMQAHLPSYILIKDGSWQTEWKERSATSRGGGYKCSLSSFEGGGVDAGRVSEHSWSDKLHNVPHEAGFSAVNEFVKDIYHTLLSSGSRLERDHRTPSINPMPAHGASSKRLGWNYAGISGDVKHKSLQVGAYEWGLERLDRDVNATRKGVV